MATRSTIGTVQISWSNLLSGLFFLALGIWVLATPLQSYLAFTLIFSISMFLSGIAEIYFFSIHRNNYKNGGWYLLGGFLDLAFGALLLLYPSLSMIILPVFVALWLLFRGIWSIGISLELKSFGESIWGLFLMLGILIVFLSLLLLSNPILGGVSIVMMTASAFIVIGIFRICVAFRLKRPPDTAD